VTAAVPVVWWVHGDKSGDNAQVEAVIERLPWPVVRKRLVFKAPFVRGKPPPLASLYHVDRRRSDRLEPPWPDLILTVGRRPAMVALWIRRQSSARTRVVLFGRPRRHPRHFALIVASAQFAVTGTNVLETTLPLMRIDADRIEAARTRWSPRFACLPRPIIGVLVGGATRPYTFGADEARTLLDLAAPYARGGTLYVTTSRRTGADAVAALAGGMPANGHLWRWGDTTENPYPALLALADGFVVTGDSMSMITEVARLGRPLAIYELPLRARSRWARSHLPDWLATLPARIKNEWLPRLGITVFPRDLTEIHRRLIAEGRAVHVGSAFAAAASTGDDELNAVVEAIVGVVALK